MGKIQYFKSVELPNGSILSCDNLRLTFQLKDDAKLISEFHQSFAFREDVDCYNPALVFGRYKYMWTIHYAEDISLSIGVGLISKNPQLTCQDGFIDFNPNKVCSIERFWVDFEYFKQFFAALSCKRCDIALDIPIERKKVFLRKDQRMYSLVLKSIDNKTEYLGTRSNVGYVKVYNKLIESSLDSALTRVEVTCDLNSSSYLDNFPSVFTMCDVNKICDDKLSSTDLVIVRNFGQIACAGLNPFENFDILKFEKRKKLEPFLPIEPISSPVMCFVDSLITSIRSSMGL